MHPSSKIPDDIHTYIDQRITLAQDVDPARWGGTDLTQDLPRNQQWMKGKFDRLYPRFALIWG